MGSHIQPENAETDIDFRIAKAIRHINIGTTKDIARAAGLSYLVVTNRMSQLKGYRILAGDRTGYRPGPEFEAYFDFYSRRYEQV
jgi:hypothetical protein